MTSTSRRIGGFANRPPGACFFSLISGLKIALRGRGPHGPPVIPTLYISLHIEQRSRQITSFYTWRL